MNYTHCTEDPMVYLHWKCQEPQTIPSQDIWTLVEFPHPYLDFRYWETCNKIS